MLFVQKQVDLDSGIRALVDTRPRVLRGEDADLDPSRLLQFLDLRDPAHPFVVLKLTD